MGEMMRAPRNHPAPSDREVVREIRFHNPALTRLGVEVLTLEELRARASATLDAPQRLEFHLLLFIESGHGTHMVDFQEFTLSAGAVIYVHPGRVQHWRMRDALQGKLLLISAEALAPVLAPADVDMKLLAFDEWPAARCHDGRTFRDAIGDVARMRSDIERYEGGDLDAAIIRHSLLALLLRLARDRQSGATPGIVAREAAIHRLFARELEASFHQRLSVLDYARRIGYSESTLSRACVAAIGHTAKIAIDRRVALEAKRLLVHSDASVAHIGHRLGFGEATNFVKFFRRMEGATPQAFRAALQPGSLSSG